MKTLLICAILLLVVLLFFVESYPITGQSIASRLLDDCILIPLSKSELPKYGIDEIVHGLNVEDKTMYYVIENESVIVKPLKNSETERARRIVRRFNQINLGYTFVVAE